MEHPRPLPQIERDIEQLDLEIDKMRAIMKGLMEERLAGIIAITPVSNGLEAIINRLRKQNQQVEVL